jgi:hypothetical protein
LVLGLPAIVVLGLEPRLDGLLLRMFILLDLVFPFVSSVVLLKPLLELFRPPSALLTLSLRGCAFVFPFTVPFTAAFSVLAGGVFPFAGSSVVFGSFS